MKITDVDAAYHIATSLDNGKVDYWYDDENEVTWAITTSSPGVFRFTFIDEDDNETEQYFKLTEV